MSDRILTEMLFRVEIFRSGIPPDVIDLDDRIIYVTALNDLLAHGMAIEISNIQLSRYWRCTVAEIEERYPIVLCGVRRIKKLGVPVRVKSLV